MPPTSQPAPAAAAAPAPAPAPATAPVPAAKADKAKIAGTWVRTDAPYKLVISDLASNGVMKAVYLNPNPIHVGQSTWSEANGMVSVYVELRDQNYPGSHYTLTYMPEQDMLAGKYFQAVQGITYEVAFSRGNK